MRIPRKPVCIVHGVHRRFGAAPIFGLGAPEEGKAIVVIFGETIRNGKIAWKKLGEARFDSHHGLFAKPYSLPSEAAVDIEECLRALPNEVWR